MAKTQKAPKAPKTEAPKEPVITLADALKAASITGALATSITNNVDSSLGIISKDVKWETCVAEGDDGAFVQNKGGKGKIVKNLAVGPGPEANEDNRGQRFVVAALIGLGLKVGGYPSQAKKGQERKKNSPYAAANTVSAIVAAVGGYDKGHLRDDFMRGLGLGSPKGNHRVPLTVQAARAVRILSWLHAKDTNDVTSEAGQTEVKRIIAECPIPAAAAA